MLVLSRKIGGGIVIGGNIKVTVVRVSGNKVQLAFEAPDSVEIWRDEVPFDDEPDSQASENPTPDTK